MRTLWKGTINFGLVNIPISLYPAMHREELKFKMLRRSDHSPINYKRVAEVDGKEVPWAEVVKGYEYEKNKFVAIDDKDFTEIYPEATQTVDIINFVAIEDVDPLLFYKPYYLEVGKGGEKAYVLLKEALTKIGKIAIAKVIIRVRQHLAAIKPIKEGLILELMHFPHELADLSEFKTPAKQIIGKAEMRMAEQLIQSMSSQWNPETYQDETHKALEKLITKKVEQGSGKTTPTTPKKKKATNVIDLVSVLQQSIQNTRSKKTTKARKKAA